MPAPSAPAAGGHSPRVFGSRFLGVVGSVLGLLAAGAVAAFAAIAWLWRRQHRS